MTDERLRVAHVLHSLAPSHWGAAETHVAAMTSLMATHDVASTVFAPLTVGSAPGTVSAPITWYSAVAPTEHRSPENLAGRPTRGNIVPIDLPLKLIADRSTLLTHVHSARRVASSVRLAMRATDRPYILSLHEPLLSDETAGVQAPILKGLITSATDTPAITPIRLSPRTRRDLDEAARVLCYHERDFRALEGHMGDRVTRMHAGVDADTVRAGDAIRAMGRWPWLRRGPSVLVIGRVGERQNQLFALRSFAQGAPCDHQLVFVGAENDLDYRHRIVEEAWALGVAERVWFTGQIGPRDTADLLAAASLVLAPSTSDSAVMTMIEAWAAGVPVVVAVDDSTRHLAMRLDVPLCTLEGADERTWGRLISSLLADEALCRTITQRSMRLVDKEFSWAAIAKQLRTLYEHTLVDFAARPRRDAKRASTRLDADENNLPVLLVR